MEMKTCERCGTEADRLYAFPHKMDDDKIITLMICWSCDHDVINGGDLFEDSGYIIAERIALAHEYDPINNPRL